MGNRKTCSGRAASVPNTTTACCIHGFPFDSGAGSECSNDTWMGVRGKREDLQAAFAPDKCGHVTRHYSIFFYFLAGGPATSHSSVASPTVKRSTVNSSTHGDVDEEEEEEEEPALKDWRPRCTTMTTQKTTCRLRVTRTTPRTRRLPGTRGA
ncbi:hypothetical protein C8R45DRAFT_943132 [Mycena sanguinolenta]|nr:hypothetical protein C8R45DRAFT_943132 [Mycena sanguinolenta]